jgi:hypothetical protein
VWKETIISIHAILSGVVMGSIGTELLIAKSPYHIFLSAFFFWIAVLIVIEYTKGVIYQKPSLLYPYFQALNMIVVIGILVWTEIMSLSNHLGINFFILCLLLLEVVSVFFVYRHKTRKIYK